MVPSARRYDPVIETLVHELDDPSTSMAETCRRVAQRAQELGLVRPSLVHLRTLVRDERDRTRAEQARREDLVELANEVTAKVAAGLVPHPYWLIDRISDAGRPRR